MHGKAISLIRRLIPGDTSTYLHLSTLYLLCIVLLLRSDRDDDVDQGRGKVVYNIG